MTTLQISAFKFQYQNSSTINISGAKWVHYGVTDYTEKRSVHACQHWL